MLTLATLLLGVAAQMAAAIPARRATLVEPIIALPQHPQPTSLSGLPHAVERH